MACVAILAGSLATAQEPQPPRFRTAVEVASVDVTVVDAGGRPVPDLTAADFVVRIDGEARRVVGAEWVALGRPAGERSAAPLLPETFSSNVNAPTGRIILIAIDQQNIRFGGAPGVRDALLGFVDRLQPADRVGVISLGPGATAVPFTADREQVKAVISQMAGQRHVIRAGQHQIAMWEALAIRRDDAEVLRMVLMRECGVDPAAASGGRGGDAITGCRAGVESQAHVMASSAVADGERTMNALKAVFESLRRIEAPKALMFVTEGFLLDDVKPSFAEVERLAAESRTSFYALRLDQRTFDASQQGALSPGSAGMDRMQLRQGLDLLASATRGRVFDVVMTPDAALRSVELELSGYYLLGVESDPTDRADRARDISVAVDRAGATVRTRRRLLAPGEPRAARDLLAAALASPLDSSAVPIHVATVSLGGLESGKVQLLVHAEIGAGHTSPRSMVVGHLLLGADGRIVDSRGVERVLQPVVGGLPSPLQYAGAASVAPGDYVLRLAATDGERVGSVERRVRVGLTDAGSIWLSDLVAGGPVYETTRLQPTMTSSVAFGHLHAFVEAYGADAPKTTVRYEVARAADAPALTAADALVRAVADDRAIFTRVLSVRRLPPGRYLLRAKVIGGSCVTNLSSARGSVADAKPAGSSPCPVLATGFVIPESFAAAPASEVFLPVSDQRLAGPFGAADASLPGDERLAVWRRVDALMRNRRLGAAQDLLQQSAARWADDARFAKPLALLYATQGRAADAVRLLQRHLAAHPGDVDSLGLAVEWFYNLRAAGATVESRAGDRALARRYAEAYQAMNGPETPLVQLWLEHIARP